MSTWRANSRHHGDVLRALNPAALDQVRGPGDRAQLIAAEKEGFKKDGVAGYAEVDGDTYIVHCERANSIRFHANMLDDKGYMEALRRAEIKTLVYTNDATKGLSTTWYPDKYYLTNPPARTRKNEFHQAPGRRGLVFFTVRRFWVLWGIYQQLCRSSTREK